MALQFSLHSSDMTKEKYVDVEIILLMFEFKNLKLYSCDILYIPKLLAAVWGTVFPLNQMYYVNAAC